MTMNPAPMLLTPPFLRHLALLLALLCFGTADLVLASPANVIIRVPTGTPVPARLPELLAKWRQSGQVANVLYLTDGRSEKPERSAKFAAIAVLDFPSEGSCESWLKADAAALPAGLIVRRADALANGELSPRDSNRSIFVVNTYTPTVPADRFAEYVAGYVHPLYEAMRGTKHLVRYTAYLERGETGKVDALNVLEYRDDVAHAAMAALKSGIRQQVAAATPTYAAFDKIKDTLRIDGYGTTATYTELPPPGSQ